MTGWQHWSTGLWKNKFFAAVTAAVSRMQIYSSECCISAGCWLATAPPFATHDTVQYLCCGWHCCCFSGFLALVFSLVLYTVYVEKHMYTIREFGRAIGQSVKLPGLTLSFCCLSSVPLPDLYSTVVVLTVSGEEKRRGEEVGVVLNFWHSLVSLDQLGEFGCCAFIKLQLNSWMSLSSHSRWESEK